jgi:hypothetical protein
MDYDPLDTAPATKQDVYSYHHSAQSSPWDESCLTVDSSILRNRGTLFSRAGAIPAGSDLKTYDLGNLWLCVSGFTGAVVCGELFVEYDVILMVPQITSNVQSATLVPGGIDVTHQVGSTSTFVGLLDVVQLLGTTISFNQNFVGTISIYGVGTVLSAHACTGTATSALYFPAVIPAAALSGSVVYTVNALRGQTLIPAWTATTITAQTVILTAS